VFGMYWSVAFICIQTHSQQLEGNQYTGLTNLPCANTEVIRTTWITSNSHASSYTAMYICCIAIWYYICDQVCKIRRSYIRICTFNFISLMKHNSASEKVRNLKFKYMYINDVYNSQTLASSSSHKIIMYDQTRVPQA